MITIKAPKNKDPKELWGLEFKNGMASAKELKPTVREWFAKHGYLVKELKEKKEIKGK